MRELGGAEAIVALSGVGKRFASGLEALDGIDLTVARGEFLSLLGPSGCGKSTLLRIIAGLSEPTRGTCRVSLGKPGKPIPSGRIGFVFQDPTLMPWSNVAANAELPFRIAGRVGAEERDRVAAALRAVGLAGFEGAYPHQLSGGMRQRAMIAMALLFTPELIIMDEPTSALDVVGQRSLMVQIKELQEQLGFAVIFVTHDMSLVRHFSDRLLVMYAAQVAELGRTDQLFERRLHPYTRGLLEAFPSIHGANERLVGIPGQPPDLLHPPSGCRFAPRCPYVMERCRAAQPPLLPVDGELVRCILHEEAALLETASKEGVA